MTTAPGAGAHRTEPSTERLCAAGRRIVVLGVTGSGKTTLARRIARRLGVPHVELDALHWGPNWTEVPTEVFRARVEAALAAEGWVVDGNYGKARDLIWGRAETIVWLDYSLPVILLRLLRRTLARLRRQAELWHGNRERWSTHFLTRDSLFLWALQTHPRARSQYPGLFAKPEHGHLTVVHLRSPREAEAWWSTVASGDV